MRKFNNCRIEIPYCAGDRHLITRGLHLHVRDPWRLYPYNAHVAYKNDSANHVKADVKLNGVNQR